MLKQKFVFMVSLVAMLAVGNAYATTPSGTDTVATKHDVYTEATNTGSSATTNVASGIAGVTYVNRMVNAAGNAAQKAEDHAAAAGASAIAAQEAAVLAQEQADKVVNKFNNKFTLDANKNAIVTTDKDGNVVPVQIADTGSGTYVTDVTVSDTGAVTLTRGTPTAYSLPNATTTTKGGVIVGSNISVSSGKISVATGSKDAKGVLQVGDNINVSSGKISVPTANGTSLGLVKQGTNITIDSDGTISAKDTVYTLPNATTSAKGGVIVGDNINVSSGKISVKTTVTQTENSGVPFTAGGAYTELAKKQDKLDYTAENSANKVQVGSGGSLTDEQKQDTSMYPSMATTSKMISDATLGIQGQLNNITSEEDGILAQAEGKINLLKKTVVSHAEDTAVGSESKPVYVKSDGSTAVVTGIDNSLLPNATTTTKGGVIVGGNIGVSNGKISVATANGTSLGVVKQGTNVSIASGAVSVADATATVKGVAMLGVIPAGADKSGTATIWVE